MLVRLARHDGRVPRPISYGPNVSDDSDLRLCGDPAGKRTLELGISDALNAVALAEQGSKAIAIDTDTERIARQRHAAEQAGVRVEFHHGDLADLGFATSASIDLAIAVGTLVDVDDLACRGALMLLDADTTLASVILFNSGARLVPVRIALAEPTDVPLIAGLSASVTVDTSK